MRYFLCDTEMNVDLLELKKKKSYQDTDMCTSREHAIGSSLGDRMIAACVINTVF